LRTLMTDLVETHPEDIGGIYHYCVSQYNACSVWIIKRRVAVACYYFMLWLFSLLADVFFYLFAMYVWNVLCMALRANAMEVTCYIFVCFFLFVRKCAWLEAEHNL
jgi:hypothetical protein